MFKKIKTIKNDLELLVKNLNEQNILFTNFRYKKLQTLKSKFYETKNKKSKKIIEVLLKRENSRFILYKIEMAKFLNKYEGDKTQNLIAESFINKKYKTCYGEYLVSISDKDKYIYAIAKDLNKKCNTFDLKKIQTKEVTINATKLFTLNESNNEDLPQLDNDKVKLFKQSELIYNLVTISLNTPYLKRDDLIVSLDLYFKKSMELQNITTTKQFKNLTLKQQLPYIHDILIGSQIVYKNTKQLNNINSCIANYISFFNERNGYKEDYQSLSK